MSKALEQLKQHLETDSNFQMAYAKILHEHLTPMLHELQALSQTAGIEITIDELGAGMTQANATLSDADLNAVAGGDAAACGAVTKIAGGGCSIAAFLTFGAAAAVSATVAGGSTMTSACID